MGAKMMFKSLDYPAPDGKEKHHGNKRKLIRRMKVKARRAERHTMKKLDAKNLATP